MHDVTQLLRAIEGGDAQATEDLLPAVYSELRRLASSKMRREKSDHTLTSTALVHEAYLRLVKPQSTKDKTTAGDKSVRQDASVNDHLNDTASHDSGNDRCPSWANRSQWANRSHFFAAAAEAMRRILIENARRKQRIKHGGSMKRHNVDDVNPAIQRSAELVALDDALNDLMSENELAGNLIKLRFFAGLTIPQAAWSLDISESHAKRLWAYARAWLYRRMYEDE